MLETKMKSSVWLDNYVGVVPNIGSSTVFPDLTAIQYTHQASQTEAVLLLHLHYNKSKIINFIKTK
jgi:hypothetical protein